MSKKIESYILGQDVITRCQTAENVGQKQLVLPPLAIRVLQRASPWLGVAEALLLSIKYTGGRTPGDVD